MKPEPKAEMNRKNETNMNEGAALMNLCREATTEYPRVEARDLYDFLVTADDPDWCTPKVAKQIAKRMQEGLIQWPR